MTGICFIYKNRYMGTPALDKPLWQCTVGDLVAVIKKHLGAEASTSRTIITKIGALELAEYLSCSESQIAKLRKQGVLDEAIVSHIGKKTVYDAEKARELAVEYMSTKQEDYEG